MSPRASVFLGLLVCAGCAGPTPASSSGVAPPLAAPPGDAAPSLPAASTGDAASASASATAAVDAGGVAASGAPSGAVRLTGKTVALPGATGNAFLDYIAYERSARRVWVPVGSTGSVDVLDTATASFTRVDGWKTVVREAGGRSRTMGPSAAFAGDGFVFIGNRATSEICAVDSKTLKPSKCLKLPLAIDGVAYVASVKEVWVTSPKDGILTILDASSPAQLAAKTTLKLAGEPEGYGVDEGRGLFYTNLEDKGGTVVIDVKTHKVRATWSAGCGSDGPRGLAVDAARSFVVVACTDHVQVLDAGHDGAKLGALDTGAGVDNIDYLDGKRLLYVAAGKAERLTVARLDDKGHLEIVATGATSPGARNAVADEAGNAYVADSPGARLWIFDGSALR
jgi:DNA-binding beta-propeller fold protein YncE